jgi:RND family efflux transporter MFP subunit
MIHMKHYKKTLLHVIFVLVILGMGMVGFSLLRESRESLGRQQLEIPLPIVRTVPVSVGELEMTINGEGTVQALTEIQLVPQISGKVIYVSDHLVNGGVFQQNELLLSIEPDDYEIAVVLAEAGLREAESQYQTALQESLAAINEWKRIYPDQTPPPLVAKEPQLEAALASVKAREADLEKARLDLRRTRIKAPFNGRVSNEQVDRGQYITPGQELATLYSTDAVEIVVPMESQALEWFDVPGFTTNHKTGAPAVVIADIAGKKRQWKGQVDRVQGKIDEKTRMIHVVIRVDDPYETQPPLVVGQFVEIEISGYRVENAAVIPRAALHEENTVWAVNPEEGRLYIRKIDIARIDTRGVIVLGGFKTGEQVAVSHLKTVTDGMKVRHLVTETKSVS